MPPQLGSPPWPAHEVAALPAFVAAAPRRDNVEDALGKLQEILDAAWKSVQPIEEDPEKKREIQKQLERGNERRLQARRAAPRAGSRRALPSAVSAALRPLRGTKRERCRRAQHVAAYARQWAL